MSTPQQQQLASSILSTSTTDSNAINSATTNVNNTKNPDASTEQSLREELHKLRRKISKREPFKPSYRFLLLQNTQVKPPKITEDKLYKRYGSNLREAVERYMNKYGTESPANDARKWTVGRHRTALDEGKMRDAFTIRECKEHEQRDLIQASLLAAKLRRRPGSLVDEGTRKRSIEAMALGCLEKEKKKVQRQKDREIFKSIQQKLQKHGLEIQKANTSDKKEAAQLEAQLRQMEQQTQDVKEKVIEARERAKAIEMSKTREKQRERERIVAEKRERERVKRDREAASRKARQMESPQEALSRLYEPVFQGLWDMEFMDNMNPFRMVIDKYNCVELNVPDYCDVVKTPMNLTYVREKVNKKEYITLQDFFGDIELLINNALLYNSDPHNSYHIAALKMKRKYIELRKQLMMQIDLNKATTQL
jgi:hypothetical protein